MAIGMEGRQYGYLHRGNDNVFIRNIPTQQVGGYGIGIVYIENVNYPFLPGNVVNACTYDYPVRMRAVQNLTNDRLFNNDPTIVDDVLQAARDLVEKDGCRAICSACGFFGNYHKIVAEALDVPVVNSRMGIDTIETGSKYFVGRCGNHGSRASHFALQTCDVLLVLGSRLAPNTTGYNVKDFSKQSNFLLYICHTH